MTTGKTSEIGMFREMVNRVCMLFLGLATGTDLRPDARLELKDKRHILTYKRHTWELTLWTCTRLCSPDSSMIVHVRRTIDELSTFSTIPSHLRLLLPTELPSWQRDWTGPIMLIVLFLVSHFNFLFVPCGGLSWLPVSFLLHVKYTLSYRIVR